jgi:transcriptional regulator with XRE-family HTH domain
LSEHAQTGIEYGALAIMGLAEKVDAALDAAGIGTRDELAARFGIAPSTLSESLTGATDSIRLKTLLRLAKELRVPLDYLIEGMDPEYDAIRRAGSSPERVVELWLRAVQLGNAEAVWWMLRLAAGVPDEPMPNLQPPRP